MRFRMSIIGLTVVVLWLAGCGLSSYPAAQPDRPAVMQADTPIEIPPANVTDASTSPSTPTPNPDRSVQQPDSPSPDKPATDAPSTSSQPTDASDPVSAPAAASGRPETKPGTHSEDIPKPSEPVKAQEATPDSPPSKPGNPAAEKPVEPEKPAEPAKSEQPWAQPPVTSEEQPRTPTAPSAADDSDQAARKAELDALAKLPPFYARYAELLKAYVDDNGNVEYSTLRRKRGDLIELSRLLDELDPQQVLFWTNEEKIALWLNAHNLFTLKLIVDNYPIKARVWGMYYPTSSIMQISGGRDKTFFKVMGLEYTLREIERDILIKRFEDPRVCFALSYASLGGAFMRNEPYYPHRLDRQLDEQAQRFVQSPRGVQIDRDESSIQLSDIFIWYKDLMITKYGSIKKFRDRPDDIRSYLNCILLYLKPEDARYLESNPPTVKFMKYDWQLNEK